MKDNGIIKELIEVYAGAIKSAETFGFTSAVIPPLIQDKAKTKEILKALEALEHPPLDVEGLWNILENINEINPNNYTHDEVCELNNAMIEVYLIVEKHIQSKLQKGNQQ